MACLMSKLVLHFLSALLALDIINSFYNPPLFCNDWKCLQATELRLMRDRHYQDYLELSHDSLQKRCTGNSNCNLSS